MSQSYRLDASERGQLEEGGFVLRRSVFDARELTAIRSACEALVQRLLAERRHRKLSVGSYNFELQRDLGTVVKWEPGDLDVVQGVEPFAHLSDELNRWAHDARILDPCKDVVGDDERNPVHREAEPEARAEGRPDRAAPGLPVLEGPDADREPGCDCDALP